MKTKITNQKPRSILLVWVVSLAVSEAATLVGDHFVLKNAAASEEGNLTIDGKFLTVGFDTTLGGVTLQYQETNNGALADISMIANDTSRAEWNWGYDDANSGMAFQMSLDSNNVLSLFDTSAAAAGITLDPGNGSAGSAAIKIDGAEVLTTSSGVQNANLNFGSGGISGNGGFGIALGNELPSVNDGSITISNSNRTIASYDYSNGFLNMHSADFNNQKLSIDPNQFVANSEFHFQSKEHFVFRTPDIANKRELIAKFTTDAANSNSSHKASVMIANATTWSGKFCPSIIGNNESPTIKHYPSLFIVGTGQSQQDVANVADYAVITLKTRVHNGDALLNSPSSSGPFTQKDIFSIENANEQPALRIAANSFVGLGTKNPEEQLHVTKNAKINGDLSVGGNTLNVFQSGSVEIGKADTNGDIPLQVGADGSVILAKAQGDISMGDFGN